MATVRDTGFAEFAASLLGGVLDAVVNAQLDQARKMLQLRQAALLDDAAFAQAWVSDDQVKAAAAELLAAGQHDIDETALRLDLARTQRNLLQGVLAQGLPRIVVDHGRVSARLMFSVDQQTATPGALGQARVLRLRATPVQAHSPAFLRLQTQITSEVEISFKTVTN